MNPNSRINQAIIRETRAALDGLAENPRVALEAAAVRTATSAVVNKVAPVVDHLTNNEKWFQSRVTLGSLAAIITSGFGLYAMLSAGITDGELLAPPVAAILGGSFSLYGRWKARKPIGEG